MKQPVEPVLPPGGSEPWWLALVVAAAVLLAGSWAYGNNDLASPHFDDTPAIVENKAIRVLHERVEALSRPDDGLARRFTAYRRALAPAAQAVYAENPLRMVANWSFTLTYDDFPFRGVPDARDSLRGWHAANDRIHLLNGLLVLCLGWLTLTSPALRRAGARVERPILLAGLAALVFVTHPLQVQAVTYLVQRTESLCATFYLLTLCCHGAARRLEQGPRRGRAPWKTGAVLGGAGLLLALAALVARTDLLEIGGLVRLVGLVAVAAAAALVVLVRRGDDEPLHAAFVVGSLVAFGLALLTKEIGATLPAAVLAWDLLFVPVTPGAAPAPVGRGAWFLRAVRSDFRTRVRDLAPWVAIVAAVVVLLPVFASFALKGQLLAEGVAEGGAGAQGQRLGTVTYLLTQQNVLCTYVRLFLLPYGQHLDWQYPIAGGLGSGATWLAFVSGALVLGALGLAIARGGRARVAAFALLLGLAVLAPTSTLVVLPDVLFEHRLYLPLAGLALVLAVVADRVAGLLPEGRRPWALAGLALVLALGLGSLARARNDAFADEVSLWRDSAEGSPGKPRPWTNLGLALLNLEPALVTYATGRVMGRPELLPDGTYLVHSTADATKGIVAAVPRGALVKIETTGGGPEPAIAAFDRALEGDPRYTKALNNLAIARIALARVAMNQLAELRRLAAAARRAGAVALAETCDVEAVTRAREARRQATLADEAFARIESPDAQHLNNRAANLAMNLGDKQGAIELLVQACGMPGSPPTSLVTLANLHQLDGFDKYDDATGLGIDPASARSSWAESRRLLELYLATGNQTFAEPAKRMREQLGEYLSGARPVPPRGSPERDATRDGSMGEPPTPPEDEQKKPK